MVELVALLLKDLAVQVAEDKKVLLKLEEREILLQQLQHKEIQVVVVLTL